MEEQLKFLEKYLTGSDEMKRAIEKVFPNIDWNTMLNAAFFRCLDKEFNINDLKEGERKSIEISMWDTMEIEISVKRLYKK